MRRITAEPGHVVVTSLTLARATAASGGYTMLERRGDLSSVRSPGPNFEERKRGRLMVSTMHVVVYATTLLVMHYNMYMEACPLVTRRLMAKVLGLIYLFSAPSVSFSADTFSPSPPSASATAAMRTRLRFLTRRRMVRSRSIWDNSGQFVMRETV